jgi:hypothetical protein
MIPLKVTGFANALGTVTARLEVNVPAPPNVNAPVFVTSPNVTVPPNEKPFAITRAVAESLESTPPVIVTTPVPKPELFPTRTVPDPIVTPPENVFTPLNVKIPVPLCINDPPTPLITPL